MSTNVFQPSDRVLVTDNGMFSGVIDAITTDLWPGSDAWIAYIWPDNDPERSGSRRLVILNSDKTAPFYPYRTTIELWDGPINGASTGVDTYDCPEPGCDFNVSAVGPQDPDEPDYFTEDIEQHQRSHECLCTFDGEGQSVDPECPQHGQAGNAKPTDREALADQLGAAAGHLESADPGCDCPLHMAITTRAVTTDRALREVTLPPADERLIVDAVARGVSSQAGLHAVMHGPTISSGGAVTTASPAPSDDSTPALVQLDQADAATRLAAAASDVLDVVRSASGIGHRHPHTLTLQAALADFQAVSDR